MTLRKVIFWCHLTAGVTGGVVIFIMSFTGVILTFEPQISAYTERHERWVIPPGLDAKRLSLDVLLAKVRQANPNARPASMTVWSDPMASVLVNFSPQDSVFVNPYTGELLGHTSPVHKAMRVIVDWHRSLGSQEIGRPITNACNLAFFVLAVTGVYLWWPRSWSWRALKPSLFFNPGLRGKARYWNWHNVIGFWSSSVLATLTLTAVVMSYPWANDLLYTLTGTLPPPRPVVLAPAGNERTPSPSEKTRSNKPAASLDLLLARAERQAPGWLFMMMRFPPRPDGPVTVSIQEPEAPHPFARSQLTLDRATGEAVKWEPYTSLVLGRRLRSWVRALHTGEAFGVGGQSVAGLASLGGCFLVWTGLAMAWRRFRSWGREPACVAVDAPPTTEPALQDGLRWVPK